MKVKSMDAILKLSTQKTRGKEFLWRLSPNFPRPKLCDKFGTISGCVPKFQIIVT
jgi:hypothetical protein